MEMGGLLPWTWALLGVMVVVLAAVLIRRNRPDPMPLGFEEAPGIDECLQLSQEYLETRRFMEAMVVCKKGIEAAPGDPREQNMLARIYLAQKKQAKAEKLLREVLRRDPENKEAAELLRHLSSEAPGREQSLPH